MAFPAEGQDWVVVPKALAITTEEATGQIKGVDGRLSAGERGESSSFTRNASVTNSNPNETEQNEVDVEKNEIKGEKDEIKVKKDETVEKDQTDKDETEKNGIEKSETSGEETKNSETDESETKKREAGNCETKKLETSTNKIEKKEGKNNETVKNDTVETETITNKTFKNETDEVETDEIEHDNSKSIKNGHQDGGALSATKLFERAMWRVTRLMELLGSVGGTEAWAHHVGGGRHLACRRLVDYACAVGALFLASPRKGEAARYSYFILFRRHWIFCFFYFPLFSIT